MKHRPPPAALTRGKPANRPPARTPQIVYIAVPDKRLLPAFRRSRTFVSDPATPIEVRAFYAPGFPNLPADALKLLGRLTEHGEVVDQPIEIVTPEKLP